MPSDTVLLIAYSEIALKGRKRSFMERFLLENALAWHRRRGLRVKGRLDQGRVALWGEFSTDVRRMPGVHHVIVAKVLEKKEPEALVEAVLDSLSPEPPIAVRVRRADKRYPMRSLELAALIGEALSLPVDLKSPRTVVQVEIRDRVYVYTSHDVLEGVGGLPYGIEGRVYVEYRGTEGLLASALLARRGASVYPAFPEEGMDALDVALPRPLVIGAPPFHPSAGRDLFPTEPCVPETTLHKIKLMLGGGVHEDLDSFGCSRPGS